MVATDVEDANDRNGLVQHGVCDDDTFPVPIVRSPGRRSSRDIPR